jgi:hypothetical protein
MFELRGLRICRSRNTTAPTQGLIGNTNIGTGFRANGVYFLFSLSCPSRYPLVSRTKVLAVAAGMIALIFSVRRMVNRSAVAALAWFKPEFVHPAIVHEGCRTALVPATVSQSIQVGNMIYVGPDQARSSLGVHEVWVNRPF